MSTKKIRPGLIMDDSVTRIPRKRLGPPRGWTVRGYLRYFRRGGRVWRPARAQEVPRG